MNRVLRTADWVDEHVAEDHSRIVRAFEQNDRATARDLIVQHSEHAKSTMHRAITDARQKCGVVSTRFFAGRFDDRVVVVTGAAQGIGRSVAERVSAEGGSVALVDRA